MSIGHLEDAISDAILIYVEDAYYRESNDFRDAATEKIYAVTVAAMHSAMQLVENEKSLDATAQML